MIYCRTRGFSVFAAQILAVVEAPFYKYVPIKYGKRPAINLFRLQLKSLQVKWVKDYRSDLQASKSKVWIQ